jgi:uncharacterized membrane protein
MAPWEMCQCPLLAYSIKQNMPVPSPAQSGGYYQPYYPVSNTDAQMHVPYGQVEHGGHNYMNHEEEEEEQGGGGPQAPFVCMSWHALGSMLFFLACSFFTILVIYALVTNNTEKVRHACPDLYPYMVTRTALSFCVFFAMCTYGLAYGPTQQPERNAVLVFFFLVYFAVLAIWGAVVVSKSMINHAECYNALYDSAFHTALLGDLGWVYIVVDVFYATCTALIILRTQCNPLEMDGSGGPQEAHAHV